MTRKFIYLVIALLMAFSIRQWNSRQPGVEGTPLAQVTVPKLSSAAMAGETLFNENCASCHGKNAAGIAGSGPPLVHIIYEPNHHGDRAFLIAAQRGVRAHHWPFGNMPPVEDITAQEVAKIIVYIRELQKENNIF